MNDTDVAIIGAGPYGLSIAAHLAQQNIRHRIFGQPMQFWSQIAAAGERRFLKSYCFGTNISTPRSGFTFADYAKPRGLETFEPCSIADFADYGRWFQKSNVAWVEPINVVQVSGGAHRFRITLASGERFGASHVIVATGLAEFAHVPHVLATLPADLLTHSSKITSFAQFKGLRVAVVGAGQSALEAAALLHEAGAQPRLLVRDPAIHWHRRVSIERSLWLKIRSPISKLGTGPKAWALTNFPGAVHRFPTRYRTDFVKGHLSAEGAWWLRERLENVVPVDLSTTVSQATPLTGCLKLQISHEFHGVSRDLEVDHMIAGTGYTVDVDQLNFLDAPLRRSIERIERAPRLNSRFESSVPGVRFVGPSSAMSFGPLFRFVVGAEYTARVITADLTSRSTIAA